MTYDKDKITKLTTDEATGETKPASSVKQTQQKSADGTYTPDYNYSAYNEAVNALTGGNRPAATAKPMTYDQKGKPIYPGSYDSSLEELYSQIVNRPKFAYDLNGDALYQQYAQQYAQLGSMAMQDTMGQAAALTGGYGSSYAQSVGQQQYNAYLQKLNAIIPELENRAYSRYQDEGNALAQQYSMLGDLRNDEYNRYLAALDQYNTDRAYELSRQNYDRDYELSQAQLELSRLNSDRDYELSQQNYELASLNAQRDYELALRNYEQSAARNVASNSTPSNSASNVSSKTYTGKTANGNSVTVNSYGEIKSGGTPTRGETKRAAEQAYKNGEITYSEYREIIRSLS